MNLKLKMFERNDDAYSIFDQDKLWNATVIIIGIGGGGGVVSELLTRTGIGHLVLVDGDRFEESNLNRQIFATQNTLNMFKVDAAKQKLLVINPLITIDVYPEFLTAKNYKSILEQYQKAVICDCADGKENKMFIADICKEYNHKLVTGGDGIFQFYVARFDNPAMKNTRTVFDGKWSDIINHPAPVTVWIQAALQTNEVINAILNRNFGAENKIQRYNLWTYTNTITEE